MANQVILLGIDGLDPQKVEKWSPSLQQDVTGNLSLNEFEEPYYTHEIWPSMILGESPRKYGWNPVREGVDQTSSAKWETPGLDALSSATEHIIPHHIRKTIGEILTLTVEDPSNALHEDDYPDDNLFEDLKHKAVEVPNWNRGELGLEFTEESWETVIDDGNLEYFFDAIEEEIDVVTQEIKSAAEQPYDIIFTHYHYLDTIQHYFDEDTQRDWYERTSELVESFCSAYPDRTIIVISDHGLGEYEHRPPGFISVSNPWTEDLPGSPTEVRPWLEEYFAEEKKNKTRHAKSISKIWAISTEKY